MAKRFTDTDKWKRPWFRQLSNDLKVVWFYLLDQCDHAGVWCADFELLEFQTGVPFERDTFLAAFDGKVEAVDEDKFFIRSFVEFQYGELNPENRAHNSVIKTLEKLGACKGLLSPSDEAKDKDKEQDKEKDKESKTRKRVSYSTGFEEIYEVYPRREGKSRAFKIYEKEIKTPEDRDSLLLAVKNYAQRKAGTEPQYLKHFSTFMGEWRDWLDEKTGTTAQTQNKPNGGLKTLADLRAAQ